MPIIGPWFQGFLILILCGDLLGAPPISWLTNQTLQRHLSEPVDLIWSENPIQPALRGLSQTHRVAVFLDPRVDPGRKVQLALKNVTLQEVLQKIAQSQNLGVTLYGPVVYYGPPDATAKLQAITELRLKDSQKATLRKKFLAAAPMAWDDFTDPRELLQGLAQKNDLILIGLENMPHDLWASADLPPLTLVERLTLLLAPFGRTYQISADGSRLSLISIPDKLPATGITGFHPLGGSRSVPAANMALENKRFTLTVEEKPVGPLLRQLARQIGLDLQMDAEALQQAGVSLDQRVSFSVKEATIDELLQAAIQNVPVRFHRQNAVIIIESSKGRRNP